MRANAGGVELSLSAESLRSQKGVAVSPASAKVEAEASGPAAERRSLASRRTSGCCRPRRAARARAAEPHGVRQVPVGGVLLMTYVPEAGPRIEQRALHIEERAFYAI